MRSLYRKTLGTFFIICSMLMVVEVVAQERQTSRVALVVGANQAGTDRPTLRYAIKDARAMADVLEELGGVNNAKVLEEPDVEGLEEELARIHDEASKQDASTRKEFIFYYSGHSDEEGLLLGEQLYPYSALKERLKSMDVDVRIVILDSCASGNLTLTKGGKRVPAFLNDRSSEVTGHAFIASSSADESAQESERLEGSFFTHAMIAGLRGAADRTGDRRVTLNEAYQFAFSETLSRTQSTLAGPQHAAYDFQLSGHGDLVLTDYGQPSSSLLQLSRTMRGKVFIRDADGVLVAEISKPQGRELEIALPPDTYDVQLVMDSRAGATSVRLRAGKQYRLTEEVFEEIPLEETVARGGVSKKTRDPRRKIPFGIDLLPFVGYSSFLPEARRAGSLNVIGGKSGGLHGFELSGLSSIITGPAKGVQVAGLGNVVQGSVSGVQVGGATNFATRGVFGLQLSGALNVSGDDLRGMQVGATNLTWGGLKGMQLGAVNLQLLDVESTGMQLGAVNISQDLKGLQLGAANFNLGIEQRGVRPLMQLGAMNYSRKPVSGFMFGVVNVAPTASGSFGVVNVFWQEKVRLTGWFNSEGGIQAGIRHGARRTYHIYSVGVHGFERLSGEDASGISPRAYSFGLTYGWHSTVTASEQLGVQIDGQSQWVFRQWRDLGTINNIYKLRAGMTYKTSDWLQMHAGATANVLVTGSPDRLLIEPIGSQRVTDDANPVQVVLWPGLFLGVDFL